MKTPWDGFVCEQGSVLDAGVWTKLPLDIQRKLLVHLPLPALVRFQLVSKAWFEAIRSIHQVTVHGDCYVAREAGKPKLLRVYSSLHEGCLTLSYPGWKKCIACTSNGLLCFHDGFEALVYNPFTQTVVTVPDPPIKCFATFLGMQSGEEVGDFTIIRVVRTGPERMLLVYKHGIGTWEATPLPLPAEEEFSRAIGIHSFHGVIHGSALYFLTRNLRTPEMSVRTVEVLGCNVTGISCKLFSWASLPLRYSVFGIDPESSGVRFSGSIAIVGGDIFMGCMRHDSDRSQHYTVALLVYNKQGKKWDSVSKMPLAKGFVPWGSELYHHVDLRSQGDTLVVCNYVASFACLYNTSTRVWSLLDKSLDLIEVCDLSLSMRS